MLALIKDCTIFALIQSNIHPSPLNPRDGATAISLNPPDRATTISRLIVGSQME